MWSSLLLFLSLCYCSTILAYHYPLPLSSSSYLKSSHRLALFNKRPGGGGGAGVGGNNNNKKINVNPIPTTNKDKLKEDQLQLQQEILQRRQNKSAMKSYFEEVNARRQAVSDSVKLKDWKSQGESGIDPLPQWLAAKQAGLINPIGYEAEPKKEDSRLGLNIVIPINPMGIPKYDNGERFDLRLPYAEIGYEDPEADVMGKIGKFFQGLFGSKKQQQQQSPLPPSTPPSSSSSSSSTTKKGR